MWLWLRIWLRCYHPWLSRCGWVLLMLQLQTRLYGPFFQNISWNAKLLKVDWAETFIVRNRPEGTFCGKLNVKEKIRDFSRLKTATAEKIIIQLEIAQVFRSECELHEVQVGALDIVLGKRHFFFSGMLSKKLIHILLLFSILLPSLISTVCQPWTYSSVMSTPYVLQ